MPTLNWLLESDEDRYLEANDIRPGPPRLVTLPCPFCSRVFIGPEPREVAGDITRHIARDHPLRRPVLVVDGQILGVNSTITRLLDRDDITIENTQTIDAEIDGDATRRVTAAELRSILTARPKRVVRLRLANERSEDSAAAGVEFRIKIDVPDPGELESVDDAFLRHLARDDASREDVLRFSDETDGLANYYRDGLVSYVVGVFAKDDTAAAHEAHSLERALDNFGRSAHHLDAFRERRVAAAVAACARLNLNELNPLSASTGVTAVDLVSQFLLQLSAEGRPTWPTRPPSVPSELRCPVDEATFSLLEFIFELGEAKPTASLDDQLDRIEHGNLTSPDRAKLAVVVGEWADRHGDADTVKRCAARRLRAGGVA